MKKSTMSRKEWEKFEDWNAELAGNRQAFQTNFLTTSELSQAFWSGKVPHASEPEQEAPEWKNELEKSLLDEMEAWQEGQRLALAALAEKLGCNVYLAAYLKHLDEKLDIIADVFGNNKVKMQEPPKRKRV